MFSWKVATLAIVHMLVVRFDELFSNHLLGKIVVGTSCSALSVSTKHTFIPWQKTRDFINLVDSCVAKRVRS